jgi:hypothetical protein
MIASSDLARIRGDEAYALAQAVTRWDAPIGPV